MKPSPSRLLEALATGSVFAMAGWLRLRDGEFVAFNRDAGLLLGMADRLRSGEAILLGIPSSKGIVNPPLAVYLVAALQYVAHSPVALARALACLQLAAIVLTWVLVRRRFGPAIALATAALYATSGWAVLYARILWPPCFAPLFSTAMLGALWAWTIERKAWALPLALALSAAVAQLHLTGFAWFVLIVVIAVLLRPPLKPAAVAAGVLAVALLFLPFVVGLATEGVMAGPKRRALFVDFIASPARFFLLSATHGGIDYHFPTLPSSLLESMVPLLGAGFVAAGFLLCAPRRGELVFERTFPWVRWNGDPRTVVPFLFVLVPVGSMVVAGLDTSAQYLILQFPAAWLFMSLAAERLAQRSMRSRLVAAASMAVIASTGLGFTLSLQSWIRTRPMWNWSAGYSTPLTDQVAAVDWIAADAGPGPVQLLAAPGDTTCNLPFNLPLLMAEKRGELIHPADLDRKATPSTRSYLVLDEAESGLSEYTRSRLNAAGARRFGALWVCRWP